MDTRQMAYRMLRHCDPADLTSLTMSQGAEVAGAMSFALAEFFAVAPNMLRKTAASVELLGEITVTGLELENGSYDVGGYEFADHFVGSTLMVGDQRTEIDSATEIMDSWKGATGTYSGVIRHDAVPFGSNRAIQRLSSHPWVLGTNGTATRQLHRVEHDHAPLGTGDFWGHAGFRQGWRDVNAGDPTHYAIIPTGNSQNSDEWFILKVHPSPRTAITLRFDIELDPVMINFIQLTCLPVSLPVSDQDYEAILLPMAEHELLASSIWAGSDMAAKKIEERYLRALALLKTKIPDRAPILNRLGTPRGY